MLNKIRNLFSRNKEVILLERPIDQPEFRKWIATEVECLTIKSPVTDEDMGFNDGIDAAVERILKGL